MQKQRCSTEQLFWKPSHVHPSLMIELRNFTHCFKKPRFIRATLGNVSKCVAECCVQKIPFSFLKAVSKCHVLIHEMDHPWTLSSACSFQNPGFYYPKRMFYNWASADLTFCVTQRMNCTNFVEAMSKLTPWS